jgi:casein kinase 1
LYYEAKIIKYLEGCSGVPNVYFYGSIGENNYMVLDLLGPCVENLFDKCGRKFSIKTVVMLGVEMVS